MVLSNMVMTTVVNGHLVILGQCG